MKRLNQFIALAAICFSLYLPGLSGPFLFDSYIALPGNQALDLDGSVFDQWRVAALSSASGPLRRRDSNPAQCLKPAPCGLFYAYQIGKYKLTDS